MQLKEPASVSYSKSIDELAKIHDVTTNVRAHTSQLIIRKYELVTSLKQQMTDIKTDFNDKILKLQKSKHDKCQQLFEKIEKLKIICGKLKPGKQCKINFEVIQEKTVEFDGKSFKVNHRMSIISIDKLRNDFSLVQ